MTPFHAPVLMRRRLSWAAGLCLSVLPLGPVLARAPAPDAQAHYQREKARCMSLRVHGERANCLSQASTAYTAALPPVPDADPGRYARNAVERCKALPDADRADCLSRMQGQGTTRGSVDEGGIYRELVTREVGPTPATVPTPAPTTPPPR